MRHPDYFCSNMAEGNEGNTSGNGGKYKGEYLGSFDHVQESELEVQVKRLREERDCVVKFITRVNDELREGNLDPAIMGEIRVMNERIREALLTPERPDADGLRVQSTPNGKHLDMSEVRHPNRTQVTEVGQQSTIIDDLVSALGRLDHRPVPPPEVFDPDSGQALEGFFELFEDYCKTSFRQDSRAGREKRAWGGLLRQYLKGDVLRAYDSLWVAGQSFEKLKEDLIGWFSSSREQLLEEARQQFSRATRQEGENVRLFAARLWKLFNIAYPTKAAKGGLHKILRRKLLDAIPPVLRERILTRESIGDSLNWDKLLEMAGSYDQQQVRVRGFLEESPSPLAVLGAGTSQVREVWQISGHQEAQRSQLPVAGGTRFNNHFSQDGRAQCRSGSGLGLLQRMDSETQTLPSHMYQAGDNFQRMGSRNLDTVRCFGCNEYGHLQKNCAKKQGLCFHCFQKGHFIASCPGRQQRNASPPLSGGNKAELRPSTGLPLNSRLPNL